MSMSIVTAPATEPVSTAEAKSQANYLPSDHDDNFRRWIKAARLLLEERTRSQFITATRRVDIDRFPLGRRVIHLPRPPLQGNVSITYVDTQGAGVTWDASKYMVDANHEPGRIAPAYGEVYPTARDQLGAVTIQFDCGYGNDPWHVPEPIRQSILLIVSHWFMNREAAEARSFKEIEFSVTSLIDPYRVKDDRVTEVL